MFILFLPFLSLLLLLPFPSPPSRSPCPSPTPSAPTPPHIPRELYRLEKAPEKGKNCNITVANSRSQIISKSFSVLMAEMVNRGELTCVCSVLANILPALACSDFLLFTFACFHSRLGGSSRRLDCAL